MNANNRRRSAASAPERGGPVLLLAGYQTPAAIRRSGAKRIETWLKNRKVRSAEVRSAGVIAKAVVEAAQAQHTALPGEKLCNDGLTELEGLSAGHTP